MNQHLYQNLNQIWDQKMNLTQIQNKKHDRLSLGGIYGNSVRSRSGYEECKYATLPLWNPSSSWLRDKVEGATRCRT